MMTDMRNTNVFTRRVFGGLFAGAATALASTKDFVQEKILRRPFYMEVEAPARQHMLMDVIRMFSKKGGVFTIIVKYKGAVEPLLQITQLFRPEEMILLRGVHDHYGDHDVQIRIESSKKIQMEGCYLVYKHPNFRRIDGMIEYHDPHFLPHLDNGHGVGVDLHHRILGGHSKDIEFARDKSRILREPGDLASDVSD